MNNSDSSISFHNLTTGYDKGKSYREVSRNLSAELSESTLVALIGRNGTGKSTLLRTIAGFLPPIEGEVCIDDTAIWTLSRRDLARKIAVVLTRHLETGFLTVAEIVAMGRQPHTGFSGILGKRDKEICEKSLKSVNAAHLLQKTFRELSDGEKQRVMIAKALAQETPFILLDEPTAFLDYPSRLETIQMLRNLAHDEGKSILFSCHDVEIAVSNADKLWLMKKDQITELQPIEFDLKMLYE